MLDILGTITAAATTGTVVFMFLDRLDKMRANAPILELDAAAESNGTARFDLTIRNLSQQRVGLHTVRVVEPKNVKLRKLEYRADKPVFTEYGEELRIGCILSDCRFPGSHITLQLYSDASFSSLGCVKLEMTFSSLSTARKSRLCVTHNIKAMTI